MDLTEEGIVKILRTMLWNCYFNDILLYFQVATVELEYPFDGWQWAKPVCPKLCHVDLLSKIVLDQIMNIDLELLLK